SGSGAASFAITADGVGDFETGDTQLTMHLEGMGSTLFPDGIDVRSVDGTAYMQLPESIGSLFGGGKWLKVPDLGLNGGGFPNLDQSDPSRFLADLETVSNSVERVGTETIRGVETMHYRASLDLAK